MGIYGNGSFDFIDEERMIRGINEAEEDEGGEDFGGGMGGNEGGLGGLGGMGGGDEGGEDEDGEEKEKEINNPSITVGQFLMTINLANRKVQIEDLDAVNKIELNFMEFKKLSKLFDEVDTRADKDEGGGGGLGGFGM